MRALEFSVMRQELRVHAGGDDFPGSDSRLTHKHQQSNSTSETSEHLGRHALFIIWKHCLCYIDVGPLALFPSWVRLMLQSAETAWILPGAVDRYAQ